MNFLLVQEMTVRDTLLAVNEQRSCRAIIGAWQKLTLGIVTRA
jgi:hypothetical protein